MKKFLLVGLMHFVVLSFLSGQSTTIELKPDFHHLNGREYITDEIEFEQTNNELEFVGLSCFQLAKQAIVISYRLKINNQWSSWIQFEKQHEFVAPQRNAYQAKPIKQTFTNIQFKLSEPPEEEFTFRFFLAGESQPTSIASPRAGDCDLPEACFRSCWCPTCPIDTSPEFSEPTHLIVHHSAGNNESNDFATVVEFIWDLHVNTNGWDDIGYNWLIDPNGVLYEGRPDGYQGAHFSCINENTVGICVIGDYTSVPPEEAAIATLVSLLAYEAEEHLIDVTAQSYHVTGDYILDNIAGHSDSSGSDNACSGTECPGETFYPMLQSIRTQVSELPCYSGITNTQQESHLDQVEVFPNPVQENLFIISEDSKFQSFEIVDIQGVKLGQVHSGIGNDVSNLKQGVYFLTYNDKVVTRIVKD